MRCGCRAVRRLERRREHGDSKALRPPHPPDAQGDSERGIEEEKPSLDSGEARCRRHEDYGEFLDH